MFYIQRYHKIEKVNYTFEVVTPMFLGGADQNEAELRVPSIKGMLRFWWRAISDKSDISELKNEEGKLFGSTDGKSKISLKIDNPDISVSKSLFNGKKFEVKTSRGTFPIDILHYLAYGTFKYVEGNVVIKEYIPAGENFVLSISAQKSVLGEIDKALSYLLTFGGIGAKSRNGFGSLYCKNIQYITDFKKSGALKEYTSFSSNTRLIKFSIHNRWEDALSEIGLAYKDARLSLEEKHNFKRRALIAKPIEVKEEEQNIPKYVKENRHSKPYFLHVNKLSNGKYQGQILFLPYSFKPFDSNENFNKYMDACNQMNEIIKSKAGGNKWE